MKWYDYLKDAENIYELNNSMNEIALCEHKKLSDYSQGEFVSTAKNILDIMQDWDKHCYDPKELRRQQRLLRAYIKKYEITEEQAQNSIDRWLNNIQ